MLYLRSLQGYEDGAFCSVLPPLRTLQRIQAETFARLACRWRVSFQARFFLLVDRTPPLQESISGRASLDEKMLFQIYSPVKEEFYLPTRKSEPGRILSIGRLVEQKFPLEFFEEFSKAARQNKKLHLHILGVIEDKAYYKTVKSFLASHDLTGRITFHENLDDQEVAAHLERCEMLVHPSVHETFGLVIAEAMAAGVPVIVRRCGGVSNLITHRKQGLSCNTAGEVGKAISLLHGNKSLQESLGKSARAFAERWRETFVVKETILAYKKIIAEQKSTGILS